MLDRLQIYGELLAENPVSFLIYMATMILAVLTSLILHECAHGYMALRCGDPTAKMMGRLTLNPLRHLDPIGTLFMFLLGFGWAKPVPVNPRNFRDYRRDDILVSIAGIVTNLTLFVLCSALSIVVSRFLWRPEMYDMMQAVYGTPEGLVNVFSSADSSVFAWNIAYGISFEHLAEFVQHGWLAYIQRFLFVMMEINLGLAIFNILPMPPLDGYHLLNDTILKGRLEEHPQIYQAVRMIGPVLIIMGALDPILRTGSEFIGSAVVRTMLMLTGQL